MDENGDEYEEVWSKMSRVLAPALPRFAAKSERNTLVSARTPSFLLFSHDDVASNASFTARHEGNPTRR